jgi:hypothetical protein
VRPGGPGDNTGALGQRRQSDGQVEEGGRIGEVRGAPAVAGPRRCRFRTAVLDIPFELAALAGKRRAEQNRRAERRREEARGQAPSCRDCPQARELELGAEARTKPHTGDRRPQWRCDRGQRPAWGSPTHTLTAANNVKVP